MVRANRKEEGSVPVRFDNYRAGKPTARCTALWGVAAMLKATEANKRSYGKLLLKKRRKKWNGMKTPENSLHSKIDAIGSSTPATMSAE